MSTTWGLHWSPCRVRNQVKLLVLRHHLEAAPTVLALLPWAGMPGVWGIGVVGTCCGSEPSSWQPCTTTLLASAGSLLPWLEQETQTWPHQGFQDAEAYLLRRPGDPEMDCGLHLRSSARHLDAPHLPRCQCQSSQSHLCSATASSARRTKPQQIACPHARHAWQELWQGGRACQAARMSTDLKSYLCQMTGCQPRRQNVKILSRRDDAALSASQALLRLLPHLAHDADPKPDSWCPAAGDQRICAAGRDRRGRTSPRVAGHGWLQLLLRQRRHVQAAAPDARPKL